jgi:hypothetical protein
VGPDVIALHDGRVMEIHDPDLCAGDRCCVHNPSLHHMRRWPLNWRPDRRIMERVCPHGVGHPDPDDIRVRASSSVSLHGCDQCCVAPDTL